MMLVIVALLPHYAFGVYNVGYQSHLASGLGTEFWPVVWTGLKTVVPIVVVVYVFGFAWETLFASVRKHEMSEGVLVTCALLPLTLPPTIPLWQAALGISFGIVIGKEIFGGTGRNFLNPALTGRAFLYFAYPAQNSGDAIWTVLSGGRTAAVDAFSGATPLSIAAVVEPTGSIQSAFSEAGYSTTKLFFGLYPGSIGGTATFLSIAGAAFLIILGIANYRIIFGCLLGLLSTSLLLNLLAGEGSMPFLSLSPLQHLIIGGSMFAFAYMATDPVSAAHMQGARWVFGFGIGALTVLIRAYNPAFPEGVGLAVLFMNLFAPLLDHIEIKLRLKKRVPNV
ncbi:MAG: NADH:ubiquinone reductase (Na(+)-transporting) subunit B, partial [Desulfobacterales bacterium]|jgi:Na+-transporting NADH:ubiquinone oxidoreductase subunit B